MFVTHYFYKRHVSRRIVPRAIFANCYRDRSYVFLIYFIVVFLDFNAVIPEDGMLQSCTQRIER